ncbi:hypothetical protein T484DRAFT_1842369 [Baffinella frigidus]|nr:hypothetical protein T484DRAFT_1842369 [Cryptophyta sp. CCMP2293]
MVMDSKTQCFLDDLGSQVPNAFFSFVVRAPKITLLSTKTVSNNASTSAPAARLPQISVRGSSPAISFEPSTPSYSCSTARDQLTNDNTRRLPPLHPLPSSPLYGCTALRRTVSCVGKPHESTGLGETRPSRDQDAAIAPSRARAPREHRALQPSGWAAARHTSQSSGWGLVGWDKHRIAYCGVPSDAVATKSRGRRQRALAKRRRSSM